MFDTIAEKILQKLYLPVFTGFYVLIDSAGSVTYLVTFPITKPKIKAHKISILQVKNSC
jgi:hypothetical protein